jgi:hypothetical protein
VLATTTQSLDSRQEVLGNWLAALGIRSFSCGSLRICTMPRRQIL